MKCPKCQFENPHTKKFCGECGAKLEKVCPNCSGSNPPQYKFCGECGHHLTVPSEPTPKDLSFDEKIDKIQRYLPKGLTEKILSQKDKIEGERKQVTVMFCDLEGFTSLSEHIGPERTYDLMNQIYKILIQKIHGYEGTVNEMTGDGVMALFGAPIAIEDAPQRAIRSAYAIHREMNLLSEKIKKENEGILPLKMRIGINTGPVVVGSLGNDLRVEFKAVGNTVNLASRVEGLAEPGTTFVTKDTFKLTEGFFRFEALKERKVKGKKEPIRIYRVIAPNTRRTRFDVIAERGLTPFIGRKRELGILLDGFEHTKEGYGQAFSIVSDAGVGKSRFLYEFRKALASADVTFIEGRCLSYSKGVVYHPLIDILKANFDIREDDSDSVTTEKVTKGLKVLKVDEALTLPYFLELLSVKESGLDKIQMSPEAKKDRIMEAFKQIVLKGSEIRPLILAFEDLHWLDNSTADVLKYILENIPRARVLIIFTYRPEFVPIWKGLSYHNQVNLNRFLNRESLTAVSHLLGTEEIASDLEELILEKTEGIPFFIEEFLCSLKDLKIIGKRGNKSHLLEKAQDVTIPSTIQDVIMARIDSLPEGAKEVLQIGSVIEREFTYELIRMVSGLPEKQLLFFLSVLKNVELLYQQGTDIYSRFVFKHSLTREVIYESILSKKQKNLHGKIGAAIEVLHKDNINEHTSALADHFIFAGEYEKGVEYSKLAALKAEKSGAIKDAIGHAKNRVAAIDLIPQTDKMQDELIDARVALGFYLFQMGHFKEAKESVVPILDLVEEKSPSSKLSMIYVFIGSYNYMVEENYSSSIRYLEEALKISEKEGDFVSFGFANYFLGLILSFNCDFDKATFYFQRLLKMSMAIKSSWRVSAMKSNLSTYAYNCQGKINMGYQTSEEALEIAEESGDILSKAMAYTHHGTSCYYKGFLEKAEHHLLKGVSLTEKINLLTHSALAHQWLGNTYFDLGRYQEAVDQYRETIHLRKYSGLFPSSEKLNRIALARAEVFSNKNNIDLKALYNAVSKNRLKLYDGWVARYMAEILIHLGKDHLSTAQTWIEKAIETDDRNGMIWNLGKDHAVYSELYELKGDLSNAQKSHETSICIFRECGADDWVYKFKHSSPNM